jgi:predicted transcriptional regulator
MDSMSKIEAETLIPLLGLPDHLRTTMIALYNQGAGTATDIAHKTKRARAVESAYLNTLRVMGLVNKERHGRNAVFTPFKTQKTSKNLWNLLQTLPADFRKILCDDMLSSLESRLQVLVKAMQK